MHLKTETIKITLGSVTSGVMGLLGSNYKLVVLLIAVMAVDTLFGHLRAVKGKEWTSNEARWGLIGKLVELVLIALMYLCEWTFDIGWLVNAVVTYFIICEGASIAENIVKGHLNDSIPSEIVEYLETLKSNAASSFKEWLKKIVGGDEK